MAEENDDLHLLLITAPLVNMKRDNKKKINISLNM
jgi:hypothetical protein